MKLIASEETQQDPDTERENNLGVQEYLILQLTKDMTAKLMYG